MQCATLRTGPVSYSKTCDTFRPLQRQAAARRTGLGRIPLIDLDERCSSPSGLVREHRPEHSPPGIKDGFRHPCFAELGSAHVTKSDKLVFAHQARRKFMEKVLASRTDLGMNGLGPLLLAGPLGDRQFGLVPPEDSRGFNGLTVAGGDNRLKPKINADLAIPTLMIVRDFAVEGYEPTSSRVTDESPRPNIIRNVSRLPKPINAVLIPNSVTIQFNGPQAERHPAKRRLAAEAGAKAWAPFMKVSRFCELLADSIHSVRMNPQFSGATGSEVCQIKVTWPFGIYSALPAALDFPLCGNTVIPDLVGSNSQPRQVLFSGRIFDPEFVPDDHLMRRNIADSANFSSQWIVN